MIYGSLFSDQIASIAFGTGTGTRTLYGLENIAEGLSITDNEYTLLENHVSLSPSTGMLNTCSKVPPANTRNCILYRDKSTRTLIERETHLQNAQFSLFLLLPGTCVLAFSTVIFMLSYQYITDRIKHNSVPRGRVTNRQPTEMQVLKVSPQKFPTISQCNCNRTVSILNPQSSILPINPRPRNLPRQPDPQNPQHITSPHPIP